MLSPSPTALRIALLEDEPGTLARLVQALRDGTGVQLAWVGDSPAEALEQLATDAADVLLVGLRPAAASGAEGLRRWRARARVQARELAPAEASTRPRRPRGGDASRPLTPKETEVLALVARGFSYEEVGRRMAVSLSTVRTHVRSIYAKLDVHSKTEAVFEARAQGLL